MILTLIAYGTKKMNIQTILFHLRPHFFVKKMHPFFLRSRVSVLNRTIRHFHSVQYYNWHKREIPTLERTILISSITLKNGYLASVRVNLFERHNLSIVSKEIRSTVEESYRGQGGGRNAVGKKGTNVSDRFDLSTTKNDDFRFRNAFYSVWNHSYRESAIPRDESAR